MTLILEYILANILAVVIQNISEWSLHKYVLHGLGIKKDSFFHHHWEHHHKCRKSSNIDSDYVDLFKGKLSSNVKKEIITLVALSVVVVLPVFLFVWNFLGLSMLFSLWTYFFVHAYSHVNVPLGLKLMPWHYDHHMGKDQNKNWGVTLPWFDWVMKTRVKNKI